MTQKHVKSYTFFYSPIKATPTFTHTSLKETRAKMGDMPVCFKPYFPIIAASSSTPFGKCGPNTR